MAYNYEFNFQNYGIFDYEKELAKNEISALLNVKNIKNSINGFLVSTNKKFDSSSLLRMTFFKSIIELSENKKMEYIPNQVFFENSSKKISGESKLIIHIDRNEIQNLNGRKESKYSLHGVHDYKGKFYPQLAKSLLNIFLQSKSGIVLDPFCGSGTSLFEANALGNLAIGIDLHPLATKIAKVKTDSHMWDVSEMKSFIEQFIYSIDNYDPKLDYSKKYSGDIDYLKSWFSPKILNKLLFLYDKILQNGNSRYYQFLEVIFSNILRECSHQDPKQLRIYKRKKFLQDFNVFGAFNDSLIKESNKVIAYNCIKPTQKYGTSSIHNIDSRKLTELKLKYFPKGIDLVITSPPYATALPYIDTDRLSLFFFNLISKKTRKKLEIEMVGNREISDFQRREFEFKMEKNESMLPRGVCDLILRIHALNSNSDAGFRKKNTAGLLYKYFSDMKQIMSEVYNVLNPGCKFLIVIGNNYTLAGKEKIIINTDRLLESIARQIGFIAHPPIDITVTAQNLSHIKNFIKENQVLVLEKSQ